MNNDPWSLREEIRRRWLTIGKAVLLVAVGATVVRWYSSIIPSDLPSALYLVVFVMYLASQKIEGRTLSIHDKAFCYFASYVLGFYIIERQVHRLTPRATAAPIMLGVFLALVPLIIYQVRHFQRLARNQAAARWVLALGLLAIVCMGYVPAVYFKWF